MGMMVADDTFLSAEGAAGRGERTAVVSGWWLVVGG